MPTPLQTRNGTTPGHSFHSHSGSLSPTSPESQGILNSGKNTPSAVVASHDGIQLRPRPASCPHLNPGSTDSSPSLVGGNSDADDGSDSSVSFAPPNPRSSKRRGDGPKGDWRARALLVDWTSSSSIEELIPPYAGDRGGKEPFPLHRLLDNRENINPDPYWCYQQVSDWRRL
jgi:hypothetical protein